MKTRVRSTLGLGAGLIATLGVTLLVMHASVTPDRPLDRKFREADREVLYRVAADSRPRLRLAQDERAVFLVTHAVVPQSTAPDGNTTYGVGIRVTQPDGRVVLARELWARSRRSRGRLQDGVWLDENAFTAEGVALADDRIVELTLPPGTEDGAVLELMPARGSQPREVLVRAYRRVALADVGTDVRRLALTARERERLATAQGVPRWEALPEEERNLHVASGWQRLSAMGEQDADYRTRTIFYTGYRSPRRLPDRDEPRIVDRFRAVAWNVLGPADLRVRSAGARAQLSVQGETGGELVLSVQDEGRDAQVRVGPGVHTITARVPEGRANVRLSTTTLDDSVPFGDAPRFDPREGERRLEPDIRWLPMYQSDAARGLGEVCWSVDGDGDIHGRTVRLDVRPTLGESPVEVPLTDVRYRFVGAEGSTVHGGLATVEGTRSEFERVRLGDDAVALTTEPVSLHLIAPAGSVRFCAATDQPASLRAHAWLPGHPQLDPLYATHARQDAPWHYAPHVLRTWLPLRAIDHRALAAARRISTLAAMCRRSSRGGSADERDDDGVRVGTVADPDTAPSGSVHRPLSELEPQGRPRRHRILEPVADGHRRPLAAVYTELSARPRRVRSEGGHADTRGLFWTDALSELGSALGIEADGRTLLDTVVRSQSGPLTLPSLEAGEHALRVVSPPSTRVFVGLPPADDTGGAHILRTAFEFPRGAPLRVSTPSGALHVWVVLYGQGVEARPDVSVHLRIDDGRPRYLVGTPVGRVTRPELEATFPASTRAAASHVDRRGESAGFARTVAFRFGDGLDVGRHEIEVWVTGLGAETALARILVAAPTPTPVASGATIVHRSVSPEEIRDDD